MKPVTDPEFSEGWKGGGRENEMWADSFGSYLFYDYFTWGGTWIPCRLSN